MAQLDTHPKYTVPAVFLTWEATFVTFCKLWAAWKATQMTYKDGCVCLKKTSASFMQAQGGKTQLYPYTAHLFLAKAKFHCVIYTHLSLSRSYSSGEEFEIEEDSMPCLLFGGDQLTVTRIRGVQRIRQNSEDKKGQLQGLVPCVEDWHPKVCLLEVCYFGA